MTNERRRPTYAPSAAELEAAAAHGPGGRATHLAERPGYYIELNRMLDVPMHARMSRRIAGLKERRPDLVGRMEDSARRRSFRSSLSRQGYSGQRLDDLVEQMVGRMGPGPFIGPKGGLWADAQHTVAYDPKQHGKITPSNCPSCRGVGHIIRRQAHMFGEGEHVSSAVCRTCNKDGKHALDIGKVKAMGLPVPHKPEAKGSGGTDVKPRASQLSLLSYRKPPEQQSLLRSMHFVIPTGDLPMFYIPLDKAFGAQGSEKPGHKYVSRKPDGKGGFVYTYADGSSDTHGNGGPTEAKGPDASEAPAQKPGPFGQKPPQAGPPQAQPPSAPGGQPSAPPSGGGGKELPSADAIGAAGKKVVDAVRAQHPELAAALEGALNVVVTGMKLRQAGQHSPAGDHKIHEGLKAFGRAFNQAAAPQSLLGEDLAGMLEAHENVQKRKLAEAQGEHNKAKVGAAQALDAIRGQLSGPGGQQIDPAAAQHAQAQQAGVAAPGTGPSTGPTAGPSTGPTAPEREPLITPPPADPNAPGPLDLQAPPAAGPSGAPVTNGQAPGADDGTVDALGLGNVDEFNARFGHDPKADAKKQAAAAQLAKLNQSAERTNAQPGAAPPPSSETEQALADVHGMAPQLEQGLQRKQQDVAARGNFERELNTAKAKRDAVFQQASDQGDAWRAREEMRGNLGPTTPPKPEVSAAAREAGTVAPGAKKKRGAAPPGVQRQGDEGPLPQRGVPGRSMVGGVMFQDGKRVTGPRTMPGKRSAVEEGIERSLDVSRIIPVIMLDDLNKSVPGGPSPAIGPTGGASPVNETPPMPDYQDIFRQPPTDESRKREAEALAIRRRADADRNSGRFGFFGSGEIKLDPSLFYVPMVRPQIMGDEASPGEREPMLTADQVLDRYKAGSEAKTQDESKDGSPVDAQTDAGRVSRSGDPDNDALAPQTSRPSAQLLDVRNAPKERVLPPRPVDEYDERVEVEGPDDEEEDPEESERFGKGLQFYIPIDESVLQKSLEALFKGINGHKYIRRVPTGNPKRPWRYFYRESAIARDATAGEEVRLDHERTVKVANVDHDGTMHIEIDGERRVVKPSEWSALLVGSYGEKFHAYAEKRAEQSINAVLKHVPIEMLADLPGDTDEERLDALQERVPEVYKKLQRAFNQAGVNPWRAKEILAHALERRGWEPEARAAVVGSVLTKRTASTSFHEIVQAAENVAGGSHVTAAHVGTVVEMRRSGDAKDDFAERVAKIAKNAERELAALSSLLAKARGGNPSFAAEALATALASTALQQINLLTTAFPGLKDRVAEQARSAMLEAESVVPQEGPKRIGGETHVYVAGDNGQPKALRARYRLMEASEIIASHDPLKSFRKREDYPENIQERAYHRDVAEQGKVVRNAQGLNPAFVANTNPDAVNGPPVVMAHGDGVIALGGNSRTMSMQVAYEKHDEKGRDLAKYLAEHAHEFGFRPEDVGALERPVLVREIEPDDRSADAQRLLVRQLNESFTQAMDPRTMQVALGRKLDDQTLGALGNDMQGDETLATFLGSPRSERFVNALMRNGIIDQRNSSQYLKKGTKLLNEDGRTLVERILVGRLVGDADILSNTGPKLVGNIASSVPYMVQAKAYGNGYDIGSDLAVALSAYNSLQNRVESGAIGAMDPKMPDAQFKRLFNYFDDLFGDRHPVVGNENATALLELLVRKPGPQQQAAVWRDYVKRAGQNPEGQSSMFGESKSPSDVLRATVAAALKGGNDDGQQRGLF